MKLSDLIIEHGPFDERHALSSYDPAALNELREELIAARTEREEMRKAAGNQLAAILNWAADEIDAQADAHGIDEPQMIDLTDHIRCFADQPHRRSLVPWPDGVPRPTIDQEGGTTVPPPDADAPSAGLSSPESDLQGSVVAQSTPGCSEGRRGRFTVEPVPAMGGDLLWLAHTDCPAHWRAEYGGETDLAELNQRADEHAEVCG